MSLLDNILNNERGAQASQDNQRASEQLGMSTNMAVEQFGRALPFRGLLKDVRGLSNGELLSGSNLAWKVHSMPVGAIGKHETRVAEGYQAIVRGDNGAILSITSDQFKPHQNSEIMDEMLAMAAAGNAKVCFAGSLDEGRKVVAIAQLHGEFSLPDTRDHGRAWNGHVGHATPQDGEDKTALFAVISGGHEIGTPFKIRGLAFRKWCGNGAFFTVSAESTFTRSHRKGLTTAEQVRIQRCYESIATEFDTYGATAARLQRVKATREQSRLYVAELLKPGFAAELGAQLGLSDVRPELIPGSAYIALAEQYRGRQVLDQLLKANEDTAGFARSGKHLLDAIVEQDGANGDNLWSAYNGITWYVDHKRGRSDESGVDASLFGAGADLKERALATAVRFAN